MEKVQPKDWIPLIKPYTKPSVARSLRQVADTLLPLLALFYLASSVAAGYAAVWLGAVLARRP